MPIWPFSLWWESSAAEVPAQSESVQPTSPVISEDVVWDPYRNADTSSWVNQANALADAHWSQMGNAYQGQWDNAQQQQQASNSFRSISQWADELYRAEAVRRRAERERRYFEQIDRTCGSLRDSMGQYVFLDETLEPAKPKVKKIKRNLPDWF